MGFELADGIDLEEPKPLPKGTRIIGVAHFDNSAANKFNPDPNTTVYWGDQNWNEMQNCFIGVLIDPAMDAARLFSPSGPSLLPRELGADALRVEVTADERSAGTSARSS